MKGYENPEDLVTGAYDDTHLADETLWASAEMYIATKDAKYLTATKTALDSNYLTGLAGQISEAMRCMILQRPRAWMQMWQRQRRKAACRCG